MRDTAWVLRVVPFQSLFIFGPVVLPGLRSETWGTQILRTTLILPIRVFEDAFVAAGDDFAHGSEVVYTEDCHHFESAVGGLVHLAVFPDDHGGYGFRALDVGDVKALDAPGEFGEHEGVGKGFLDGFARRLENTEALDVGLLCVLSGQVDERALFSALGDGDFYAVVDAFGEKGGESFAVVEIDGDQDGAGDVLLVDVELLEEGGENGAGVEGGSLLSHP